MIKLRNVTKIYKSKSGETAALKDVSLSFADKGMTFILGKSGCGKSTMLNLLGGLDRPTEGDILVGGRSLAKCKARELDDYRNSLVGFVFQEYNLIENYTVGVNVGLACELQGESADRAAIEALLTKLHLVDAAGNTFFDRYVNELSGGQKQRVAIARALIKDPKILLADEPTGALDSKTGKAFYELLKEISRDRLVIVVTHDRKSAEAYGDRIVELADGQVVADSAPAQETASKDEANIYAKRKGLALKRALFMGFEGIKAGPVRFLISVLLSVVTLMVFGFSLTSIQADMLSTEVYTMYDLNYRIAFIRKGRDFTEADYENLVELNQGKAPLKMYELQNYWVFTGENYGEIKGENNPYLDIADLGDAYFLEVRDTTKEEDLLLTKDSRFVNKALCRLPQTLDEVAIPDIYADLFLKYGYRSAEGTYSEIKTVDELIGKRIGGLTVCGVYETEVDADYFRAYDIDNYGLSERDAALGMDYKLEELANRYFAGARMSSILNCVFVKEGFSLAQQGGGGYKDYYAVVLNDDIEQNIAILKTLPLDLQRYESFMTFVSSLVGNAGALTGENNERLLMIAAWCLVGFSMLVTLNFLLVSVEKRGKELGVLRAIGASAGDINRVCLAESAFNATASFVLSVVGSIVLCNVANAYYMVSLYHFKFVFALLMFLLTVGYTAAATLLAMANVARKKPIDVLKRG